jgi:hypothetical protein
VGFEEEAVAVEARVMEGVMGETAVREANNNLVDFEEEVVVEEVAVKVVVVVEVGAEEDNQKQEVMAVKVEQVDN